MKRDRESLQIDAVSQASWSEDSKVGFRKVMRSWENHLNDQTHLDQISARKWIPSFAVKSKAF